MILKDTDELIRLTNTPAADIDVLVTYVDLTASSGAIEAGATPNTYTGAQTNATILGSPASGVRRKVKYLSITNRDSADATAVTINYYDGTTSVEQARAVTLLPNETLVYADGTWFHYDANGGVYGATVAIEDPRIQFKHVGADHSNSTTTGTEVGDLEFSNLTPGTYQVSYALILQSSTAGTGVGIGINFTGTAARQVMKMRYHDAGGLSTGTGTMDDIAANPGNMLSGPCARAFSSTTPNLVSAAVATVDVDIYATVEVTVVVTATGNLELWHASETAVATRVESGSNAVLRKVA